MLPKTADPVVIRTDFENQQAWETIRGLIRAPVHQGSYTFYAYVDYLEDGVPDPHRRAAGSGAYETTMTSNFSSLSTAPRFPTQISLF